MVYKSRSERRGIPHLSFGGSGEVRTERRDAAERRRRILGAARKLFGEKGVDAVSMYEVGRTAGVGQGTLYRRYEHKGALCSALLAESAERFSEEIQARDESGDSSLAMLEHLLVRLVDFNEENGPLLGAMRDAAGGGRRHEVYRGPFYGWLRDTTVTLLTRAVEEGEARPLDVEYAADALLAPLNIDLYLFQRHELGMQPERIAAALRGLLLHGLRPS